MATKTKSPKSCGPKHLEEEAPSHDWELERLTEYAQRFHQLIADGERTLAPHYWRLGNALAIARKNFQHGQWQKYLASIEIDRTRSSKALAIFRTFSTVEALESRSVEEAYEARHGDAETMEIEDPQSDSLSKFAGALSKIESVAETTLEHALELSREEKQELVTNLRSTIACLEDYVRRLEQELTSRDDDFDDAGA
jgi:hypothetical protein